MSTGKAESRRAEQKAAEDRALARTSIAAAKEPTFFEQRAQEDFEKHSAWKAAKDYRKLSPGMISLGYGDVDQRNRMRERTFNMASTGLSALAGSGNATALKMAKLNMNDEHDRSQAEQYERAVQAEDTYQRTGSAQWAGMANNRNLGIASLYNSTAQNSAQLAAQLRPTNLLPGLVSGGLSGLASAYADSRRNRHPAQIQSARLQRPQDYQNFFNGS